MALLSEDIKKQIKTQLADNPKPITLHVFTQELECRDCRENRVLAKEVAQCAPDKVKVEVHDFVTAKEAVAKFKIEQIPALAVIGEKDYGIRFYGITSGYEFASLLNAIKSVSKGRTEFSKISLAKLGAITNPLHIKVFVTLTCPDCPGAVRLAHQLAIASPLIQADMIEVSQFPHLAIREQVTGVPTTVLAGVRSFAASLTETKVV